MERTSSKALIVFQKNAVQGKVKTRLAAALGNSKALEIYRELLKYTHAQIALVHEVDVFVYFSDFIDNNELTAMSPDFQYRIQNGSDLGVRMKNAFKEVFALGYDKASIIGTDCPEITYRHIEDSFKALDSVSVVFGPAEDGGYYLLAMDRMEDDLFDNIKWSTETVLRDSIQKLDDANYRLLETLSDIDTERDWKNLRNLITSTNE